MKRSCQSRAIGVGEDSSVHPLSFRPERADEEPGATLLRGFITELEQLYGPLNYAVTPSATPEDLSPDAGGGFLVGYDGSGAAVACGGVKRIGETTGEIKRMFVAPEARGRGVARALLAALEDAARALGYERIRLDTGAKQPHARALYASAGYDAIPDYNRNAYAAYWFEKAL
jgi:GNAT superfamily N-acetyltransferase